LVNAAIGIELDWNRLRRGGGDSRTVLTMTKRVTMPIRT